VRGAHEFFGGKMATIKKFLRGSAVAVIAFAGTAAYADSPPAVGFQNSSVVRFEDLNLNRPRDVARLYNRIALVADKVCGPRSLSGSYSKSADYASCYADTLAQAVAHVDQPALTAYFRQRWSEPVSPGATIAQR
jgi:UrcA family protein